MTKKTLLIISLVLTIVSIIYILLTYFGIIRYVSLRFSKSKPYINSYNTLEPADKNNKVVVSLSTPANILKHDKIRPTINSILDQTVKVNQIAWNIPNIDDDVSTQNLEKNNCYKDIISVFNIKKDYGYGSNLIPTLLREGNADTKIICLDNDYVYGKDLIENLVEASSKNPTKMICSTGAILIKPNFFDINIINTTSKFNKEWLMMFLKNEKMDIGNNDTYKVLF